MCKCSILCFISVRIRKTIFFFFAFDYLYKYSEIIIILFKVSGNINKKKNRQVNKITKH